MATKYIVDNLSGQTINGDLTINGNLSVTGTSNNSGTYRALLTQTGSLNGDSSYFNDRLIIGETYEITDYQDYDDFSNVADVQSGAALLDFYYDWSPVVGITGNFNGLTGTTSGSGSGASFDGYWCGTTTPIIINITIVGLLSHTLLWTKAFDFPNHCFVFCLSIQESLLFVKYFEPTKVESTCFFFFFLNHFYYYY